MAFVRALKPCYVGSLRETGDEFDYAGPPASYLTLLDGEFAKFAPKKGSAPALAPVALPGVEQLIAERDAALERAVTAETDLATVTAERDALAEQIALLKGPDAPDADAVVVDDLADVRTVPGDSAEKLEAIEREVDEANGKLTPAQDAALDHDGDNKAGGSTPKAGRSPEEEAERADLFATFKSLGVKVFAGSTTEKLRAKLAEIEAETAPK